MTRFQDEAADEQAALQRTIRLSMVVEHHLRQIAHGKAAASLKHLL